MSDTTRPLVLLESAVQFGDDCIDVFSSGAAQQLRQLLGPVVSSYTFPGAGRMVDLLHSGVMLLTQQEGDSMLSIMVCMDAADASPYAAFSVVPIFTGGVECAGHRFLGGESESSISRLPGVSGFPGLLAMDLSHLHGGLHFKKQRNSIGKRIGPRRLVLLDAEWGGIKGFSKDASFGRGVTQRG